MVTPMISELDSPNHDWYHFGTFGYGLDWEANMFESLILT